MAKATMKADMENAYIEKDQAQSEDLRDEMIRHFLRNEPSPGIEWEASALLTLLPLIDHDEIVKCCGTLKTVNSCVIKATEHRKSISEATLKKVIAEVTRMEELRQVRPFFPLVLHLLLLSIGFNQC